MSRTSQRKSPSRDAARRALLDRIREDAPVSRRDYLRILVTVSGGLLVGAGVIAAGAFRRRTGVAPPVKVAEELAMGESVLFAYPTEADHAIAVRLPNGMLVAYSSICTHLACGVLYERDDDELFCPCHHGRFATRTGEVLAGPPPRPLPVIDLEERADGIWAVRAR